MKVGFIGVGTMGRPMAGHLIDGGHELWLHDLAPVPQALLEKGAKACRSGKEVAKAAEVIITMVPDTPHVEAALFGSDGIANGLSPGKLVIDMSSIAPLATREFARRINQLGCDYLDAPVSGGEVGARAASLTIMVGGPEAAFARAKPLLEPARPEHHAGRRQRRWPDRQGREPDRGRDDHPGGRRGVGVRLQGRRRPGPGARSADGRLCQLEGARDQHGQRMIERNFEPGFRVELHQKDLGLALVAARMLGLYLPGTAAAQHLFNACVAMGAQAADHSAMVRALETLSAHEIGHRPGTDVLD